MYKHVPSNPRFLNQWGMGLVIVGDGGGGGDPVMDSHCRGQHAGPHSHCHLGMSGTSRGSEQLRLSAWRNPKNLGRLGLGKFLNACVRSCPPSLCKYLLSMCSEPELLGVTFSLEDAAHQPVQTPRRASEVLSYPISQCGELRLQDERSCAGWRLNGGHRRSELRGLGFVCSAFCLPACLASRQSLSSYMPGIELCFQISWVWCLVFYLRAITTLPDVV